MELFGKMFGKNDLESQLKEEIRSLELRKESVFRSINNEITQLMAEKNEVLLKAGENAYQSWCKKDFEEIRLEEYWNKVQELEKQIAEKDAKRMEMGNRYDEEIMLINNNLVGNNATVGANMLCPKCNASVNENDMFCEKCGGRLKN